MVSIPYKINIKYRKYLKLLIRQIYNLNTKKWLNTRKKIGFKSIIHSIKYIPKTKNNLNYLKWNQFLFIIFEKDTISYKKKHNLWTIISIIFYKKDTNYFRYMWIVCDMCVHIPIAFLKKNSHNFVFNVFLQAKGPDYLPTQNTVGKNNPWYQRCWVENGRKWSTYEVIWKLW